MSRIDVLKNSLVKKQEKLDAKFDNHFADVKSANGQPLNDKRNGHVTLNRWEKQNDSIRATMAEIEKTKQAIEKEEYKIERSQEVKDILPPAILELLESGVLTQWRKFPNFFFVKGVEKARLEYIKDKNIVAHRYVGEIPKGVGQYEIFRDVFNKLKKDLLEYSENK